MFKRFGRLVLILAACFPAVGQQIDWAKFFQEELSHDRAVQSAALRLAASHVLPTLCSGRADIVAPEIPGLIEQLQQSNPQIRLQASAFLFTVARFRSDSAAVLAPAVPVFIDHTEHDAVPQTRRNCVNALAELKPDMPTETLPLMLSLIAGSDTAVQPGAIFGLARMANSHPEAAQALRDILSQKDSTGRKKWVIRALPAAAVRDVELLTALGAFLSDRSAELQRAALLAISLIGMGLVPFY